MILNEEENVRHIPLAHSIHSRSRLSAFNMIKDDESRAALLELFGKKRAKKREKVRDPFSALRNRNGSKTL